MDEKKDSSILIEIISQLNDTTKNLRFQILILGIAAIMAFCGAWNSFKFGWFQSRVYVYQDTMKWYDNLNSGNPPSNLTNEETKHFKKCLEVFNINKPSKSIIESELINYQQARTENIVLIKIPFLGICFDINDLGLFCGICFTLLYYLIFYTLLQRHYLINSTLVLIKTIKDVKERRNAYFVLLTNQILSMEKLDLRGYSILRLTPRLFYIIPVLVYIGILFYDLFTIDVALTQWQSPFKGYFSLAVGFIFLSLISVLACLCWIRANKTIELWKSQIPKNISKILSKDSHEEKN